MGVHFLRIMMLGWLVVACGRVANRPEAPTTSADSASLVLTSQTLTVKIISPVDGAVVNTPKVGVVFEAPADTVISLADEIVVVDATGQVVVTVQLEEGPNPIDIVASDAAGNEVNGVLTVTYDPES